MPSISRIVLRFAILIALTVAPVPAQTQSFDIAGFTPPQGWKVEWPQGKVAMTHIDQSARTYCMLGLYASTPSSGNPDSDFAREWDQIVRNGFSAGAAPRPASGRTRHGLSYREGGAGVGKGASYAHLIVFAAGNRSLTVLALATDRAAFGARQAAIQGFLDSLRLPAASSPGVIPPGREGTRAPVSRFTYQIPAGWSRAESGGTVTLARVVDLGFGVKRDYRLVILPLERIAGTALETYHALWRRVIGGIFLSRTHPLPLRVRLPGGAALFYDGDSMRLRQNNSEVDGFLYAALDGVMVAPVLGFFSGWDDELDRALRQFFHSFRLPGGPGQPEPLFSPLEIAGVWRSSSSTLANWVDAFGNYRGDASVATGETLTIRPDGFYESQFAAISSGSRLRQHDVGRFRVEDDVLVLSPNNPGQKQSRYRITGAGRSADGRGSFLLLGVTRDDFPFLSAGSKRPRAGDLYVSVR
ncbi:MAG: hypothetical protein HYR60_06985 [Acidobacteria bacterium]|nr:hypothetical protein [Acidobacteriota bacterium]